MPTPTVPRHRGETALFAIAARVGLCCALCACSGAPELEPHAESCSIAPPPDGLNPETHVVYLFYADGRSEIPSGVSCDEESVPPAFACSYGGEQGILGCQVATQKILDFWFAEYNVVFTLQPPPSGPFQTIVVTHEGSWCGIPAAIAGRGRFDCTDQRQGVAYAFSCGKSALLCANGIAHEYAHIVGLEHVFSQTDIMSPGLCGERCAGFEDWEYPLEAGGSLCGESTSQNSRQALLARLGAWEAGETPKPEPFDCQGNNGHE